MREVIVWYPPKNSNKGEGWEKRTVYITERGNGMVKALLRALSEMNVRTEGSSVLDLVPLSVPLRHAIPVRLASAVSRAARQRSIPTNGMGRHPW